MNSAGLSMAVLYQVSLTCCPGFAPIPNILCH
jgi:hypothetical protein